MESRPMNLPFKGLICTIILLACKYYVCHDTAVWQGLSDEVDKVFPQHVNDCDTQLGLWYIYVTLIFLYIRIPFNYTYIHIKHLLIHTWVIPLPVLVRSDSILCTVRNLPLKTRASWRSLLLASDHPLSLAHLLCTWTREDVSYSLLKKRCHIQIH